MVKYSRYVIEPADNGIIVRYSDDEGETTTVFEDGPYSNLPAVLGLLRHLSDTLIDPEHNSRHAKERIYIEVRPGDKHPDSDTTSD